MSGAASATSLDGGVGQSVSLDAVRDHAGHCDRKGRSSGGLVHLCAPVYKLVSSRGLLPSHRANPSTDFTVEACHFAPPWPVGTLLVQTAAIALSDRPAFRSALIRLHHAALSDGGRPSRTP